MKITMRVTLTVGALLLAAASVYSWQAPQLLPFSADFSQTGGSGGQTNTGKMYISLPKIRMEANNGGRTAIVIMDETKQTSDILIPQQHMYIESSTNQQNPMMRQGAKPPSHDPNHPCGPDITCQKAGEETVNGRVCDKWVSTDSKGSIIAWIDQKLHFPVKVQSANGSVWQMTNIKEGQQDASLFEIPAGYRKMDLPNMMGVRPPQ